MAAVTKKISRKDIAKMSFRDFLRAAKGPYGRLFSYMRPYMRRFWLGLAFGICFAAANAALIFVVKHAGDLVMPSAQTLEELKRGGGTYAHMPEFIRNWAAPGPDGRAPFHFVVAVCMAIPVIMAIRGLFSYLNAYCVLWVSQRVLDDIRQQVYRSTLGQAMEFYNRQKAGDLVQTVFNQTRVAQQALTGIASDIVKQPVTILSAVAIMLFYDWRFTIAALGLFPLCLVPVLIVSRKVRKSAAREEEEAGQMMVLM